MKTWKSKDYIFLCVLLLCGRAVGAQQQKKANNLPWNKKGITAEGCHVLAYEPGSVGNAKPPSPNRGESVRVVMYRKDGRYTLLSPFYTIGRLEGVPSEEAGFILKGSRKAFNEVMSYHRQGFDLVVVVKDVQQEQVSEVCDGANFKSEVKQQNLGGIASFEHTKAIILPIRKYFKKLKHLRGYTLFE